MTNRLSKQALTTYVPGIPGTPYLPAYCVQSPQVVTTQLQKTPKNTWKALSSGTTQTYGSNSGSLALIPIPANPLTQEEAFTYFQYVSPVDEPASGSNFHPTADYTYTYSGGGQTCYPAVPATPGTPAQILTQDILGWNGGASSIATLSGDCYATFKFPPKPIAVVCGLAGGDASADYNEATHAFYAHGTTLQIVERGVVVATVTGVTLSTQPTLTIIRRGARVTYHVGAWQYTSGSQSSGPVVLDAALYSSSDYVDVPVFAALSGVSLAVPQGGGFAWSLRALDAHLGIAQAGFAWRLPKLTNTITGVQTGLNRFSWTLPSLAALLSDHAVGMLDLHLPLLRSTISSGAPQFAVGGFAWVLPPLQPSLVMKTGGLVHFAWILPKPAYLFADRPYAQFKLELPAFNTYMDDGPMAGTYGVMEPVALVDFYHSAGTLLGVIQDGLGFDLELTLLLIFEADYYDGLLISESWTVTQLIAAMIRDGLAVNSSLANTQREALQYAVNIATGAVSTYQNFDFLGFVQAGGETYGYRADGLYRLGGNTDDGALMEALLDIGSIDPGSNLKQRMECAYLGLSTDGHAFMRLVGDDGEEWLYEIEQRADAARAKFGRGLQSREWRVSLKLIDVTAVDLQSIEFVLYTASRRWKG